jgi:hypothetical protein
LELPGVLLELYDFFEKFPLFKFFWISLDLRFSNPPGSTCKPGTTHKRDKTMKNKVANNRHGIDLKTHY